MKSEESEMKSRNKKVVSKLLGMMLIASLAVGCGSKEKNENVSQVPSTEQIESLLSTEMLSTEEFVSEQQKQIIGEGAVEFLFTVVDKDGNETVFEVHTDKEIVGDVLLEEGLIAGEEGQYGLYVKTVNGITADYDTDGTYWAFYIDNEYAMSGVDTTAIKEGTVYTFKVEK